MVVGPWCVKVWRCSLWLRQAPLLPLHGYDSAQPNGKGVIAKAAGETGILSDSSSSRFVRVLFDSVSVSGPECYFLGGLEGTVKVGKAACDGGGDICPFNSTSPRMHL